MKAEKLVICALSCALICILAPVAIPVGAVPVTLSSFVIFVMAGSLDLRYSLTSVLLYIFLGALGLPVFSGFSGGIGHILGPTGGFIVGYIPFSFALWLAYRSERRLVRVSFILLGSFVFYAFGLCHYLLVSEAELSSALLTVFLPFLPADILKFTLGALIIPKLRTAIKKF